MLITLALSLVVLPSVAALPGPCDHLSRAAASELLGQPVTTPSPSGPEPDEDTGGIRTVCVYQAGTRMLILIRVDFANAAAARAATTRELVGERFNEDGSDFTISEAAGLGDLGYWAFSPNAAAFIVMKGASVSSLTLGGMPKDAVTYQAQLRAATVTATSKP